MIMHRTDATVTAMPSVDVAGVAWPYDKIAMVLLTVCAVALTILVGGSIELSSWVGLSVACVSALVIRLHYGAQAQRG